MTKRLFDIVCSLIGIIILLPVFAILYLWIVLDSKGGVLYKQIRVGKNNKDFTLLKFRSMYADSDKQGLLTVGGRDKRITKSGYFLRKYKLDELPQLFNVLFGDMSLVGPRPEVRRYVGMYSTDQLIVLSVRPGITDYASIEYSSENDLLASADDPEELYITRIMPDKLRLNMKYINERGVFTDIKIIIKTIFKIIS